MSIATAEFEAAQADDPLDDVRMGPGADAPHVVPPAPWNRPAAAPEAPPASRNRALSRLLSIADGYLRAGELHQALEMYFDLMASHPETPEADEAEGRALEVAARHERAGELRMARAIYERLA